MLVSSVPNPASSSPNLSDQHKAIRRVIARPVPDLGMMLFALTHAIFAMCVGRDMAPCALEGLEIR